MLWACMKTGVCMLSSAGFPTRVASGMTCKSPFAFPRRKHCKVEACSSKHEPNRFWCIAAVLQQFYTHNKCSNKTNHDEPTHVWTTTAMGNIICVHHSILRWARSWNTMTVNNSVKGLLLPLKVSPVALPWKGWVPSCMYGHATSTHNSPSEQPDNLSHDKSTWEPQGLHW